MEFDIKARTLASGVCLVELFGEVDAYTSRVARRELDGLIQQGHWKYVVDLGEVSFIDSAGLGMLVRFLRQLHDGGGALVLSRVGPYARRLFHVTGLEAVFCFADDPRTAEALALETRPLAASGHS